MPKRRRRFRPLALEPIEPRRLLAFAAELVADVDDRPRWFATNPQEIAPLGDEVVYVGFARGVGKELFKSDGTKEGTHLLKDLLPGLLWSEPAGLVNLNGTLFFSAKTANNGRELWRSDGTAAGTYLFKDIRPGKGGSDPKSLVNVDGTLYFTANDGAHGTELWKSDGTWAGTKMVKDIDPAAGSGPRELSGANGLVFFTTPGADNQSILWRSDGTAAGTQPLAADGLRTTRLFDRAEVNDTLFFIGEGETTGRELWRTDGSVAGTRLVADLNPGAAHGAPEDLTNLNGTVLFHANDGVHGEELWWSDGTAEGTALVRDLNPGPGGFNPYHLLNASGVLYFSDELGRGLWKSDGTAEGTTQVYNFFSNGAYANLRYASGAADGRVYFSADAGDGFELWRTDGMTGGTVQVKDIRPGKGVTYNGYNAPFSSYPTDFTPLGSGVVFSAVDENGRHLWFSDGTEAGTQRLDDIVPHTPSAGVDGLYNFNDKLLFEGADGDGAALWINDGTGVHKLANTGGGASEFATIGDTVYFAAEPITPFGTSAGRELWKTDGTAAGTVLVADINTHTGSSRYFPFRHEYGSEPSDFIAINGKVVFAATSKFQDFSKQLWITDGTAEGTTMLKDIVVGRTRVDRSFIKLGAHVYFTAFASGRGYQLWRTDGTEAGTVIVKEIVAADNQPNPGVDDLTLIDGTIFFSATDAAHGRELWKSDGTAAGTVLVRDLRAGSAGSSVDNLVNVDGTLFFTTSSVHNVFSLWKSDGTSEGTKFVMNIGAARNFANVGDTLFFSSNLGGAGYELWKSDGTATGTQLVKDLAPGAKSSNPDHLQEINDILFFEAELPGGGRGLWRSDGSEGDTWPVVPAGTGLSGEQSLTNVSSELYFAGTDFEHGQELWKLNTAHPVVQFSGTINYQENDPPKLIAPWARVSDQDDGAFAGGLLSVVIEANADSGDRLEIRHQGDGPGQIGFDGTSSTVRYQGNVIGTIRDSSPGSRLIVKLNADATWDATQALLRNITYRNLSDNPSTAPRTLVVTLSDGNGGKSQPVRKAINVEAVNDPPRLVLGGQVSYKNNSPPILLAPSAIVSDVDSANFLDGLLTVEITSGRGPSNRLWVSGAYTLQGDRLLRNGIIMGTVVENGFGWNALKLRFNARMTAPLVQELVRSLRFRTFDNNNLDPRTIAFTLTDGDGGVSATQTKTVNLTA